MLDDFTGSPGARAELRKSGINVAGVLLAVAVSILGVAAVVTLLTDCARPSPPVVDASQCITIVVAGTDAGITHSPGM